VAQAEPPTAVLVANVASAVGALHTAYTLGLSVSSADMAAALPAGV
jgi:DNA-binding LacI/PurR family transcriptional regulator